MRYRSEAFTEDGALRYRAWGGWLTVAERGPDGGYTTTTRISTVYHPGDDPVTLEHLAVARRLGCDVGDQDRFTAQAAADLAARGTGWADDLGALAGPAALFGARVAAVDDPDVFDTVELRDGSLLFQRAPGTEWVVVGWSDASKARRHRTAGEPRPFDPDDHDPS